MVALSTPPTPHPRPTPARTRSSRAWGMWVLIGVPVLLLLSLAWQVGSPLFQTQIAVRTAVAVSRIALEGDPAGARVEFVLVDASGVETTASGDLTVKVREPDGTLWQTNRSVSSSDFGPLPAGGLLAGRTGYSVVVPAADWARPPRQGGAAIVSVELRPSDGSAALSATTSQPYP